jgi:hypothetical protein
MSLSDCRNCDGDTALFILYRACASVAALTACSNARRIEAPVGRLTAPCVTTLIAIVLVVGVANPPSGLFESGGTPPTQMCASHPYDFEGGVEAIS